jgi:hypothetical protein
VRGEAGLRLLEAGFLRLERLTSKFLPDAVNPVLHSGAVVK